jgi:hypothetical protein
MVIQELYDPVPHIIVDNFLSTKENTQVLEYIEQRLSSFSDGTVTNPAGRQEYNLDYKRNGNIWLDPFECNIVDMFRNHMYDIQTDVEQLDHTNRQHEVLLSQYVTGDYYNWHTDLDGHCTWNYFAYKEPRRFSGGDFLLSDQIVDGNTPTNYKTINCMNNRLVIFPAKYQHSVTPVSGPFVDFMHLRYSVQIFFR